MVLKTALFHTLFEKKVVNRETAFGERVSFEEALSTLKLVLI
jgi:hypothetical protein